MSITEKIKSMESRLMLIGGEWVSGSSGETLPVVNPATGDVIGTASRANAADVDAAVGAAGRAFADGSWTGKSADERSRILWRIAELIEANFEELAQTETRNLGAPLWLTRHQMHSAAEAFRYYAGWATKFHGRTTDISKPGSPGFAFTRKEPVGVVAMITPWNFPLMAASWKLGPALAAGCTAVVKPSEETPLTTLRLGELLMEAGVPAGVVNIVTGDGVTGAAMTAHPEVRKVSFTGSTEIGKRIVLAAAGNLKRVTLELGGKSPLVICDDADLARAIPAAAQVMFVNSGQVCAAGSRVFVDRKIYDLVIGGIAAAAGKIVPGDPTDPATVMGPLVSERQFTRVTALVESGRQEGATVIAGGEKVGERGFFFQPTLLTNVTPSMRVVREEIFGPVVCAVPFDDVETILPELNNTEFGLAAYVWTKDVSRANRLAAGIQAGTVFINSGGTVDYRVPFGGFKQSGWGREHGPEGIEEYLETKTVIIDLNP